MPYFDKTLVITHILYRNTPPHDALEGPYSSVSHALVSILQNVETCQIPLSGFNEPLIYGQWEKSHNLKIPSFLGKLTTLKYLIDIFIIVFFTIRFNLTNRNKKRLIIGIDPLSCFPIVFLKKIFNYRLVFYSVDFNKSRFKNRLLQVLYEKADGVSTKFSDQTWVVSESLQKYKKRKFNIESFYMPNSPIFNDIFYKDGEKIKMGNKMAWTGSLSERSFDILFNLLSEIQEKIRKDMEFYFAPMQNHKKFRDYGKKFGLKKFKVLELHSRAEWQKFAATYDVGIAVYDPQFGSIEFIEPLKIWDFMMCGMPFIISCEPSISEPIKKSGVAFFLKPDNKLPKNNSLKSFLKKENIKKLQPKCIQLAREFDIRRQIEKALKKI